MTYIFGSVLVRQAARPPLSIYIEQGPSVTLTQSKSGPTDQRDTARLTTGNTQEMSRPLLLALQRPTIPFSAPPSSVPSRSGNRVHSQKKLPASPVPRRSLAVAIGTAYAPRPTHKAGDPGIWKDPGKVSGGFYCRTLFWGQSEQFPVFLLRQETIEILQHGLFCVRVRTEFLHYAVT